MLPNLTYQLILMFILQFLDGGITWLCIQKYNDVSIEANPIILWLMGQTSVVVALLITKTIVCLLGWFLAYRSRLLALSIMNYIYIIVVISNTLMFIQ